MTPPPGRDDRTAADRQANAKDRWGKDPYAKQRWQAKRRRERDEHRNYDPRPPTDDDWTSADEGERLRILTAPKAIGELLGDVVQQRRWEVRVQGATVFNRWADIIGEDNVRFAEPVRLINGILVIRAVNPSWATQLRYMLSHIAERANAVIGEGMVREVKLTVGPLEGTANAVEGGDA